jgi:hypothetical protein
MKRVISGGCMILFLFVLGCKDNETVKNPNNVVPNDFLSGSYYNKMIVEIQYVNGFAPSTSTVNSLISFLQQRLNKPSGISVVQTAISAPGKTTYSLDEAASIEASNRTQATNGHTLTAYFIFLDGEYSANSGNSKILGVAYAPTSMVIFEKTVRDFSGGATQPPVATLETIVVEHEFSHLLGLVDNATAMQTPHRDSAHGKHCDNQNCLMYYLAETSNIVANVAGGNLPVLDANCLADLKANGGK